VGGAVGIVDDYCVNPGPTTLLEENFIPAFVNINFNFLLIVNNAI
jgi:hypothetical protein